MYKSLEVTLPINPTHMGHFDITWGARASGVWVVIYSWAVTHTGVMV